MKSFHKPLNREFSRLLSVVFCCISISAAQGQIYVTNGLLFAGTVGEYNLDGTTVNASLISGLLEPSAIAVAGSNLFVSTPMNDRIGKYTTSGATVNASLISSQSLGIAISGSNLFVVDRFDQLIGEYDLDGTPINASLISGLNNPGPIAVSGSNLFVGDFGARTVGEYTVDGTPVNTSLISGLDINGLAVSGSYLFVANGNAIGKYNLDGTLVNVSLISGLNNLKDIAVSGSNLFVLSSISSSGTSIGTIGEYNLDGTPVNASLVSGLVNPSDFTVVATPEPSPTPLIILGGSLLVYWHLRNRRTT